MSAGLNEYNIDDCGDIQLSEHFKLSEFQCNDGSFYIKVYSELVEKLELLRHLASIKLGHDASIIITSGYRTPSYNEAVGGAEHSRHKDGSAADVNINGLTGKQIFVLMKQAGFRGIGDYVKYPNMAHGDVRPMNKYAEWHY